ncbi:hypothetical protein JCM6882_008764 [Rhodosporidiobolus microsporus]
MASAPTAAAPTFASTEAGSTATPVATTQGTPAGAKASESDALDKGVDAVLGKFGHGGNRGTTEKISDGIRTLFKKATGKDVPIKDKN